MNESTWKWLLTDKLSHDSEFYNVDGIEPIRESLPDAVSVLSEHRFEVTNVAAYLLRHSGDKVYLLPRLSRPFPVFWMEYDASGEDGSARFAIRFRSGNEELLAFDIFFQREGSRVIQRQGYCRLSDHRVLSIHSLAVDQLNRETLEACVYPALFAMALMGCRNARLCEVSPSRQQRRHAERTKGFGLVHYQVITIPSGNSRRSGHPSKIVGCQYHQAFHIRRGHFKTYDGERGLFGSRKGTWWWTPHTAGSIENGVVVSDYSVKAQNTTNDSRI